MICHLVRHSVSLFLLAYRLYLLRRVRTAKYKYYGKDYWN